MYLCVLCTGCYQGESSRAADILHQTWGRGGQVQSHHRLRQEHHFEILLGLTKIKVTIFIVCKIWVFRQHGMLLESLTYSVDLQDSSSKSRDLLEADFLAPAGGDEVDRDALFTFSDISLLFVILFPQASLWSCIPARCLCLRWRPCTMASWLTVPPPSTLKSRSSKTSRRTFRRRTRGCRKQTENVSACCCSLTPFCFSAPALHPLTEYRFCWWHYQQCTVINELFILTFCLEKLVQHHILYPCREETVQTGGSEGDGRHLFRDEQLHHAALSKAGVGGVLPHPVQCTALCSQRHSSHTQSGSHPSCTGKSKN